MIEVKLQGGLGNQMFQYAAGLALAKQNNSVVQLDLGFLLDRTPRENFVYRDFDLDIFGIVPGKRVGRESFFSWKKWVDRKGKKNGVNSFSKDIQNVYVEKDLDFDPYFLSMRGNVYLNGYFHSYKYFENINVHITDTFKVRQQLTETEELYLQMLLAREAVCVNIRRTDFVNNDFHGTCSIEYYIQAIKHMRSELEAPFFYVFSDDPQWCSKVFAKSKDIEIVGHEYKGWKFGTYLRLMTACKHFVIPNSSFAWWAAWLNQDWDKIVIAPGVWLQGPNWKAKDLIPDSWIRRDVLTGKLV